jgi:hypothetical protein
MEFESLVKLLGNVTYVWSIMLAKEYGAAKVGDDLKQIASRLMLFDFNLTGKALIQHQRSIR